MLVFPKFDLQIRRGEAVAIQCNNEVGTQLIHMILGLTPILNGEILLEDEPLNRNFKSLSHRLGVLLLNDSLYDRLTPRGYLTFFKQLYDVKGEIDSLIQRVSLDEKANTRISKLTFSEKKRLQLAKAILHQPDFVLMEEPDQNVDIESKIIIQNVVEDLTSHGKAVLITTSNFESAISMSNQVYRLDGEGLKKIEVKNEYENNVEKSTNDHAETKPGDLKPNELNDEKGVGENISNEEEEVTVASRQIRFDKIPAKINDKMILFDPTEIDFIESNEGISHLHVHGEVFPCSMTLNELFVRLQPFGFFRCHRSYIVNLQKVREVITWSKNSYSLILEDSKKSSVPLSKGKLNEMKETIGI